MANLKIIQLLIILDLEILRSSLALFVLGLHLVQIDFELLEQPLDGLFVVLLQALNLGNKSSLHLELLLLQSQGIGVLSIQLLDIVGLNLLDSSQVVGLHLLHRFKVLLILQLLLLLQVLVALLEVPNVEILLLLNLFVLTLEALLALCELHLDLLLGEGEVVFELFVALLPFGHLVSFDEDDIG